MPAADPSAPQFPSQAPLAAARVLQALETRGWEAWLVGGWVRDRLLGEDPHDVDVTTDAPWPEAKAALEAAGIRVVETGTKHGTVTAVVGRVPVEVTTYRVDGAYSDGRHPDSVTFVRSVEEDLARRDLTFNAMAWHPERGLLDPFGGARDLTAGVVRAVGDPDTRFSEDALRVLRAVRFAARLGFGIEPATQAALDRRAPGLARVSSERIGAELRGILRSGRSGWVLREQRAALFSAVPELAPMDGFPQATPYHCYDVLHHVARVCDYVQVFSGGVVPEPLAWAALFHDVGKPDTLSIGEDGVAHFYGHPSRGRQVTERVLRRLAVPTSVAVPALALVRLHDRPTVPERTSVLKLLRSLDQMAPGQAAGLFFQLMALRRADAAAKAPAYRDYAVELDRVEAEGRSLVAERAPLRARDLAVSGRDVMEVLDLPPGPGVGAQLERLLDAVNRGEVPNERGALLRLLES
ncbi:HD domain-containing protein [Olsenella sp. YH-ols2217]|uniref:HD domain-containing protein n=1 Tax=Kribbibacterium absianum TaxID=3044210 RepID=A0ABT6ZJP2_9ACTN|nr:MULTISPECIES: HD domain-containing protein [unclassified Olsenella]MDJ1121253.1 HD domain-containing protein [Olsenella sp. YH-ols2216]MDJ1128743.1 HD domain-containing protein [Olsenella sp. YH-ols2217]